jgi:hypothetical protein
LRETQCREGEPRWGRMRAMVRAAVPLGAVHAGGRRTRLVLVCASTSCTTRRRTAGASISPLSLHGNPSQMKGAAGAWVWVWTSITGWGFQDGGSINNLGCWFQICPQDPGFLLRKNQIRSNPFDFDLYKMFILCPPPGVLANV